MATLVPFFWLVKFAVLVWCLVSGSNSGSKIIFGKVISPLYVKFGKQIDDFVCNIGDAFVVGDIAAEVTTAVAEVIEDVKEVGENVLEDVTDEVTTAVAKVVADNLLEDAVDIGSKISRNNIVGGFAHLVEQVGKSID